MRHSVQSFLQQVRFDFQPEFFLTQSVDFLGIKDSLGGIFLEHKVLDFFCTGTGILLQPLHFRFYLRALCVGGTI
ncbi:hypothetical protein [Desulfohalobium retbaense]|uniref:hypothetical protein n=1 Tax=Desulfohalobium retbaense TaxID=45663 RepID=UPI001427C468|nr:hypothetical protein [Desulfohalobium retbaense]